jgi:anti-anti-sigma factor
MGNCEHTGQRRWDAISTRADGLGLLVDPASFVYVVGDIDTGNAARLAVAIEQPISVRIDLSRVGFMDSSAMAVLTRAYSQHQLQGTELVVCRPNGMPRRAMELMGLDFMFCERPEVEQPPSSHRGPDG